MRSMRQTEAPRDQNSIPHREARSAQSKRDHAHNGIAEPYSSEP